MTQAGFKIDRVRRHAKRCDPYMISLTPQDAADIAGAYDAMLLALKAISKRIDAGSGSASWTAREHEVIDAIISAAE